MIFFIKYPHLNIDSETQTTPVISIVNEIFSLHNFLFQIQMEGRKLTQLGDDNLFQVKWRDVKFPLSP